MYLFFDTETTGLPRSWKAPVTNLNNWPRLVQLAYLCYDKNGNNISGGDHIIKPAGFIIPKEATRIHGISTEKANQEGIALLTVLGNFQTLINQAEYLVAHNIKFDEKIIGAEFLRNKMQNSVATKKRFVPCRALLIFANLMGLMAINGRSFLNCTTNCSTQILRKRIMQLLTFMRLQNVFGN